VGLECAFGNLDDAAFQPPCLTLYFGQGKLCVIRADKSVKVVIRAATDYKYRVTAAIYRLVMSRNAGSATKRQP